MKALILSATSDIGIELVKNFKSKNIEVFGTYNKTRPNLEILPRENWFNFQVKDFSSENYKSWLSKICPWDIFISCVGTLKPIGNFEENNPKEWVEGVNQNSSYQVASLMTAMPYRNKEKISSAIFFAGGGTNSATTAYSSYTIGKISLIKSVELLNHELNDLKVSILGPGWVKTKIHNQILFAEDKAGENFQKTLEILKKPENMNPITKVVEDISKIIELPKTLIGGRNFSSVYDDLSSENLKRLLKLDPDFYKLRRSSNNQ